MNNMNEALAWLYSNRNSVKDIQLKRISFIINDLKLRPSYKVIEITGTNGKGSTTAFLKNILKRNGLKVGAFTSPFVKVFNERIAINDKLIEDSDILRYVNILKDYQASYRVSFNDKIPFFELMLLMALMYFKDNNVDIALLECGIGGRYDAVNSIAGDLSIITSIGFDHMEALGDTIESITYHKLGIARANKPLVIASKSPSIEILNYTKENNIPLYNVYPLVKPLDYPNFIFREKSYKLSLIGSFQYYNASIAIEAARLLYPDINNEAIYEGLLETNLPGRMEIVSKKPLIIADGAHNISAIKEIIEYLSRGPYKINIFYSGLKDKQYEEILTYLMRYTNKFYFTYLDDARAVDPSVFLRIVNGNGTIYNSIEEAMDSIKIPDDELILVTGSLHFVGKFLNTKFN